MDLFVAKINDLFDYFLNKNFELRNDKKFVCTFGKVKKNFELVEIR